MFSSKIDFYVLELQRNVLVMLLAYKKTVDGRWICSWNCGFEDYDIGKVSRHETDVHCNKKGR